MRLDRYPTHWITLSRRRSPRHALVLDVVRFYVSTRGLSLESALRGSKFAIGLRLSQDPNARQCTYDRFDPLPRATISDSKLPMSTILRTITSDTAGIPSTNTGPRPGDKINNIEFRRLPRSVGSGLGCLWCRVSNHPRFSRGQMEGISALYILPVRDGAVTQKQLYHFVMTSF